jgi:UDP-N-acetylmuramoyl-L-alanyl-D-glutamate--2,6-diaminopimelate ligase
VSDQPIDPATIPVRVPVIPVTNAGDAASKLAHILHGQPTQTLKVMGVTGTNGKTTTTYLIQHLLRQVDKPCGLVGTVQIDDGGRVIESEMTTPGAVEVAQLMARMVRNGCVACAIETSSHALDQGRVAGVRFSGAGFTNLTHDHLDYHGTMENYAAAKARLFEMLDADAVAAVNADDPWTARMVRDCRGRIVTFGMKTTTADYSARDIKVTAKGTHFILHGPDGSAEVSMRLIGRHNIENALCAATLVAETVGLTVHQIATGLADAAGAPGRLQRVDAGQPFAILVDYAHTDDALKNVLMALRPLCRGKLRVLFGCGGDRDRTKRPKMAGISAELADALYITSDNPRTEDPKAIVDEILSGLPKNLQKPVFVDIDRRTAIRQIVADAGPDDVVLIAGKGHENYQILGKTKHHFDDTEEATAAVGVIKAEPNHAR